MTPSEAATAPAADLGRPLLIIAAVALAHIPSVAAPPINFEFAFADAARYFSSRDGLLLEQYFHYQANTLGFPLLAWAVSEVLGVADMQVLMRVLNLLGLLPFGLGIWRLARRLGRSDRGLTLLLLLANPLVWTFSGRATADFLPAALGLFAVALVLEETPGRGRLLAAGLLLGGAGFLKPHALSLLLIVGAGAMASRRPADLAAAAVVGLIAAAVFGLFLVAIHAFFGFWLTPPQFQDEHRLATADFPGRLVQYSGYLVLLGLPVSVVMPDFRHRIVAHWRPALVIAGVIFWLGSRALPASEELNFGPLDRWLSPPLVSGALALLAVGVLAPILLQDEANAAARCRRWIGAGILAVLVGLSLSRPAQRYLMSVVPLFVLAAPVAAVRLRLLVIACVAGFMLLNGYILASQWARGAAAQALLTEISRAGLVGVTDPGAIEPHCGNGFFRTRTDAPSYVVVEGFPEGARLSVRKSVAAVSAAYSLMPAATPHP